ncbi:MAG TPA: PD-(D/E)XK nuclease family protein, partial [Bacillota bacterium]|nr:PD-(D/E)XK nuclease family protein [Bacillota bacterium]
GFVDKLLLGPIPQVVDFKSNNITSQNVPQLTDYYRLQLEVYAYAVQKIVGAKEVELALHYLVPDETVSWRFNDWQKLEEQLLDLAWQMAQGQAEEDFPANPQSCKYCRFAKYKLCPEALSEEKNSVKIKSS